MAGADLAIEGGGTLVRAAGGMGMVGPVSPSSGGARRRRAPGAEESELAGKAQAWAERTADAQGLPKGVTDESVIAEVAVLLASGREQVRSGAPDGLDALRLEAVAPSDESRVDDDAREDSSDDRSLASGVKVRPLRPEHPGPPDEAVERRGA